MGLNYNPASVTQGLVYYLDLTNSRCYSGSGNTLTNLANGAIGITIVSGITYDTDYRKNLNFNGSSGYMTGNDTNLNFSTSDFTIQTTLKLNGLSNGFTGAYGSIICAGSALTNNSSIFYVSGTATSYYAVAIYHEPTLAITGRNFNFQTNKIYNLAVTKRYNVVEFFVDGSSIGTTTTSNNYNFTANGFTMGRWFASGVEQYLKGSIFDFRAYNRALSIDEIQQNYFSQTKRYYNEENIVTNGLVFNIDASKSNSYAGVGNTIYDISGSGKIGTLNNGPTFSGLNGGSIAFDGSNDYILFPNSDVMGSVYTQNIWFKKNSSNVADLADAQYSGALVYSGSIVFYYTNVPPVTLTAYYSFTIGVWYCLSLVRGSSIKEIYLNGNILASTGSTDMYDAPGTNFVIGSNGGNSEFLNGNISQVQIYNRALSAQEISQNFNATKGRYGL